MEAEAADTAKTLCSTDAQGKGWKEITHATSY